MKTLSRLLTVLVVGLFTACQPEEIPNQAEDSLDAQNGSIAQQATGSRFMAYGDVITIVSYFPHIAELISQGFSIHDSRGIS